MGGDSVVSRPPAPARRDAVRNYHRILEAARAVLGESGADASMEEIAARAGVGVGTVYRRFANKEALIDELIRLSYDEVQDASRRALAAPGGAGLELFLRGLGALFAAHAKYAHLLLQRSNSSAASAQVRGVLEELTARALAAGTLNPGVDPGRRDGADLGHPRDHRDGGRGRARRLAALPRHPPGRPVRPGPAQRGPAAVGPAAGRAAAARLGS